MMKTKHYKLPIIFSLLLHLIIFALLFVHFSVAKKRSISHMSIIRAVAVNENQLKPKSISQSMPSELRVVKQEPLSPKAIRQIEQIALRQVEVAKEPLKPIVQKPTQHFESILKAPDLKKEKEPLLELPEMDEASVKRREEEKRERRKAELKKKEEQLAKKQREEEIKQLKLAKEREKRAEELAKKIAQEVEEQQDSQKKQAETKEGVADAESKAQGSEQLASKDEQSSASKNSSNEVGEVDKYKQLIVESISRKWLMPTLENKDIYCQVLVHVGPGGVVINVDILKESGDVNLDRSATNAIMKASPLPVPESSDLFDNFRSLRLTFRPQGIISN
jgi:colicin import membrane protein